MSRLRTLLEDRRSVLIMGILNVTPDSFFDGGRFLDPAAAAARLEAVVAEGADLIDIGAESTRPGSSPVPDAEQIDRIGHTIRQAASRGAVVSIDTTSARVAEHALREGACVINSVSLSEASDLGALAARSGAALVLMHSRGSMAEMRGFSLYEDDAYTDVVADVMRECKAAADRAIAAGLPREDLLLDPGLGFFKNAAQSLELCARLNELCALGFPIVVGPSRKSFIARAALRCPARGSDRPPLAPPEQRLGGTIAAALLCAARGAAIVRVHDVAAVRQALDVAAAIDRLSPGRGLLNTRGNPAGSIVSEPAPRWGA
jgi:dihydropteroate synthase